ncbi:MAG: GIY-YIG nuclease family protein [Anaerolineales bacterium]|nr:GIY-YIG nuclease family protein [Anaerolineales bacterium]
MTACYCYIVQCADGTFYTGWALDPEKRVAVHNKGCGAKYTKMRLPVKLVYVEPQLDRIAAMKRERAIKKLKRIEKEKLIQGEEVHTETGTQVHR